MLFAERFHCQGRGDGGINAARKPDHHVLETAFADVVAEAEDQAAPDFFGVIVRSNRIARLPVQVHHGVVLFERWRAEDRFSVAIDDDGRSVEEQLVVATDLIHIDERDVVAHGDLREEVVTRFSLSSIERRGRDVEKNLRPLPRQLIDGVIAIQLRAQDFIIEPEVFACHRGPQSSPISPARSSAAHRRRRMWAEGPCAAAAGSFRSARGSRSCAAACRTTFRCE